MSLALKEVSLTNGEVSIASMRPKQIQKQDLPLNNFHAFLSPPAGMYTRQAHETLYIFINLSSHSFDSKTRKPPTVKRRQAVQCAPKTNKTTGRPKRTTMLSSNLEDARCKAKTRGHGRTPFLQLQASWSFSSPIRKL